MKAIIFDLDGTLIDSIPAHQHITQAVAKDFSLELNESDFVKVNGMRSRDGIALLAREKHIDIDIEEFMKLHEQRLSKIFDFIKEVPDAISSLKKLSSFKKAVATSSPKEYMDTALSQFHLEPFFDVRISSNDVHKAKPTPDIFLKAAEELGVKPEECVVVEDAPQGIIAANRAGMTSIAILSTTQKKYFINEAEPKSFISSLRELHNHPLLKSS